MASVDLQREREFKLLLDSELPLPELDGVGGLRVAKLESRDLVATYWDTPDLGLARWGSTLRHRTDQGWCVKLSAAGDDSALVRDEVVLEGGDTPPADVMGLLMAQRRGRELAPIARLAASREVFGVVDAGGRSVAIITDDDVRATGDAVRVPRSREVEIELAEGVDEAAVGPLVEALVAAGADASDPRPKLFRALDLPARPGPEFVVPQVSVAPTAREVIHAAIAGATRQLIEALPGAWLGEDPEGVHQARVAMRRLRSDLGTFGALVDRRVASDLRSELSWLGSSLGAVRDADVLIENVTELHAAWEGLDGPSITALLTALRRHRSRSRRTMRSALLSSRSSDLLDALVSASLDPPLVPQADDPAAEVMRSLVRRRWVRMRNAAHRISDGSPDSDLHALRIQAKRLRYAAEAVAPATGEGARLLSKAAARIQASLGDLNDCVVATELLRKVAGDGPGAFAAGQISGLLVARAQEDRRRWSRAWSDLDRPRNIEWLDE